MIWSWDADGHVEEWEGTFADPYFDTASKDKRPVVIDPKGDGMLMWQIAGRAEPFKFGGSPVSMNNKPSLEQDRLAEWRGTMETAELRAAKPRLELMDNEHTTMAVNYPTMLLKWPVSPDPALSQAITRSYNNWIGDVSNQAPDRLKWVSVVDFFDPKWAAQEIRRTKDMGSLGVMLSGVVGDKYIDDPTFEPIWEAIAETGMVAAVHPMVASETYGADVFHFSVLNGFKRIILSGLLDRYPNLKVGFLETSCTWVDFMAWRTMEEIDQIVERHKVGINVGRNVPKMTPEEYIKSGRIYVGFEVEDEALPYMVERWGLDCWLYASDIPHAHRILDAGNHFMGREDLADDAKRKLLVDNTAAFYGLPVPE